MLLPEEELDKEEKRELEEARKEIKEGYGVNLKDLIKELGWPKLFPYFPEANIEKFMEDVSKEAFLSNVKKQYVVLRRLEIIGEATKNLSENLKVNYPQVPWKEIAGMRDKLVHQYFGVDLELVWETMRRELPELKDQII